MRIISGTYRGRRIAGPTAPGLRPATDRVRESVFNILQNRLDLAGISVLDLFAGTGSLGFEAISRGAGTVTFVDDTRASTELIRKNAAALGCAEACEIVTQDAVGFLAGEKGSYGLIFADPPYEYDRLPEIPRMVHSTGVLGEGGYLIVEHRRGTVFQEAFDPGSVFTRRFGNTEVSFFHRPHGTAGSQDGRDPEQETRTPIAGSGPVGHP